MAILLTEARAKELVQMPKRVLKESEFAWVPCQPPGAPAKPGKKPRVQNPRVIKVRLIEVGGRELFLLSGNANGTYGFSLLWHEHILTRIDSTPDHENPKGPLGEAGEKFTGSHVHYYVPGHGVRTAYGTTDFDQSDIDSGLRFFLKLCNVQSPPPLQEVLLLR